MTTLKKSNLLRFTPDQKGARIVSSQEGSTKMEILIILGFVVFWFALQAWILPRFGVST
jgi:hypothetical protein